MRAIEFIIEAAYDGLRDRLLRQYPDQAQDINNLTAWAKATLVKPDRVIWWLKYVEKFLGKTGIAVDELHVAKNQLGHLMSIQYQPLQDYVFGNQTVPQVLQGLRELEAKYKERANKAAPVGVQEGDRIIQDFGNGMQWVYTNRAYCADEGRSGRHCGNIVGQSKTDQRILSLRKQGHVQATFILEPNGELGEMKGVGNTKPGASLHPYILWLLKQSFVKGIKGGGYAPSQNFSIRDLDDTQLADLRQARPDMGIDRNYYSQVLAINEQNKSIIQEVLNAVNDYQQEATEWTWFTHGTNNGSDDVEDFIEFADIMAEYQGDDDAESTYSFDSIPQLMHKNILTRLDYYDDEEPVPFEELEQMRDIVEQCTVTTQLTPEHRSGSWTLVSPDGERIKTGRFRF